MIDAMKDEISKIGCFDSFVTVFGEKIFGWGLDGIKVWNVATSELIKKISGRFVAFDHHPNLPILAAACEEVEYLL